MGVRHLLVVECVGIADVGQRPRRDFGLKLNGPDHLDPPVGSENLPPRKAKGDFRVFEHEGGTVSQVDGQFVLRRDDVALIPNGKHDFLSLLNIPL